MFRKVESPRRYQAANIRLYFCLLIGCLAVHFLVEDALLFSAFAPLNSTASNATPANYEEIQHLDDLVYAERLPDNPADPVRSTTFLGIATSIRQVRFPIFTPPKS